MQHSYRPVRLLIGLLLISLGPSTSCHLAFPFDLPAMDQGPSNTDGPDITPDAITDAADAAAEDVVPAVDAAAVDADAGPWPAFGLVAPVKGINTVADGEDDPTLTGDMLEIYFERSEDIWRATRTSTSAPWSTPAKVAALNSPDEDGTPDIAVDGLTIFFASRRPGAGVKGGIEIYVASRASRSVPWGAPKLVPELNTPNDDLCAAPSGDLLTMVLDSDRPGGLGGRDLFVATRGGLKQLWTSPSALVGLNSSVDDECPWIGAKGTLLLFGSDRPGGAGGHDIWFSARGAPKAGFPTPTPLPGVNSASNDGDPWLSPDRKTLYFYSNRSGSGDIYVAQAP